MMEYLNAFCGDVLVSDITTLQWKVIANQVDMLLKQHC